MHTQALKVPHDKYMDLQELKTRSLDSLPHEDDSKQKRKRAEEIEKEVKT